MVLTDDRERMELRDAIGDALPCLTKVFCHINVWSEVIGAVAIKCHIAAAGSKAAWHDTGDKGVLWKARDLAIEVLPSRSTILGKLEVSIINTNPKHTLLRRAFLNRDDLGEAILAISTRHHGLRYLAAHDWQLVAVKPSCQVLGTYPVVATVLRYKQLVGSNINRFRVMRGQRDWRVPVPAKGIPTRVTRADTLALTRRRINAADGTVLRFCVHDVRVGWVNLGLEAISTLDVKPLIIGHATAIKRSAWCAPRSIVLKASVDVVREPEVVANFIRLGYREGIHVVP